MLKQLFLYGIAATVIMLALAVCGASEETTPTQGLSSPSPPPPAPAQTNDTSVSASPVDPAKPSSGQGTPLTIVNEDPGGSGEYKFNPSEIAFAVGETVDFTMTTETELHNFTVDDLGIDEDVEPGESVTFSFTFDRAGTYKFICIFHEINGMVGTITVK